MSMFARTPAPPYYAVIFSSTLGGDTTGYTDMASHMVNLASRQPGFLGIESARAEIGITVSYWQDLESIANWKANAEHRVAQHLGREQWYSGFRLRIALVEREYGVDRS